MELASTLTAAIDNASKVANTPLFTTVIDRITGFKISEWAAEGEVKKKIILEKYENAKSSGIDGVPFIKNLRETTNLIDVAVKSSKYIEDGKANEIEFENDFFWNTIEHSKTVSNKDVQELIAKIIAGEYNQPGTYSMSTLHCLKMLGKEEIKMLENIGSLCMGERIPKQIFALPESISLLMSKLDIDFSTLLSLQSLGLILPNDMTHHHLNPNKEELHLGYFSKLLKFIPSSETDFLIKMPEYYELSKQGKEILKNLDPKFNEEYFEWIKVNYKIANYQLKPD